MSLVRFIATKIKLDSNWDMRELSLAGLLNTETGDAILEIQKILKSIDPDTTIQVLDICNSLYYSQPISYLDHPLKSFEFQTVSNDELTLQSNRLASLFSADGGETWYDIDRSPSFRKFWLFIYKDLFRCPNWMKSFVQKKLLYYVSFPYESENCRTYSVKTTKVS